MSELIIMRHGQASFLSGNYDQLSERGVEQSRRLGAWWGAQEIFPTRIVVGPRKRHEQSAEAMMAAMKAAGAPCPDAVPDARLDEFDWDGLFRYANTSLSANDPEIAKLRLAYENSAEMADRRRTIQHYMEAVTGHWAREAFVEEGLESWCAFQDRVRAALVEHTENAGRGSRIVWVTSGGVAAVTAGLVLGLSPEKTLGLIWTLRNGALVEFLFNGGRISLSAFNNAPHLPHRELWTFR